MNLRNRSLVFSLAILFRLALFQPATAFAAQDDQTQAGAQELANPFSDFVPFEDEYDVEDDERFMYFGRFFAVSLGTGLHTFAGNIGKLYNTAIPVLDFKLIYFFDFRLAGQVGISSASHAFTALPDIGPVQVSLMRINADLKYYFDTKNTGALITAMNPYIVAGVSQTFRSQNFLAQVTNQKDNAFAADGGFGMEFALKPRKTSIGIEARYHEIFFNDRNADTFINSGIPDLTGPMFSLITSLVFFF